MAAMTRRRFVQYGIGTGAALALPWPMRSAFASAGPKLKPHLEPLPLPGAGIVVATPTGPSQYSFTQTQIERQLHPQLPPQPRFGLTTTVPDCPVRRDPSGWQLWRRAGRRSRSALLTICQAHTQSGSPSICERRRSAIKCG